MKYSAIVVAAGSGVRAGLGYNKVFYEIEEGKTVLDLSCHLFLEDEDCRALILVLSKEDMDPIKPYGKLVSVEGGKTRNESVSHGLRAAKEEYVLIHDGARPFLTKRTLERLKEKVVETKACIPVHPATETVKIVREGIIQETVDRNTVFFAETPQAFLREELLEAFEKAKGRNFTDDAAVMEAAGHHVHILIDEDPNPKITWPEDLKQWKSGK